MIETIISINNGNEAFGTTGKTLTLNERPKEISLDFVAEELHHKMRHFEKEDIQQVLSGFIDVAARLMAEGFGIQYTNTKDDVMLRLYTDARLACQNINLAKARELLQEPTLTEEQMVERAGELVQLAGVKLRPYVEVQQKFHEKLQEYKPKYQVKDVKEVAYVPKKDGTGANTNTGGSDNQGQQGGDNGGQGDGGIE
jgi:hypothetical protein